MKGTTVLTITLCLMSTAFHNVTPWSDTEDGAVSLGHNCAFAGDDLRSEDPVTSPVDCSSHCLASENCTHFNWGQSNNMCHLLKVDMPPKYKLFRPVHSSGDACGFVKLRVEALRQKLLVFDKL